ncbi:MAG TPA: hypothetical protein VFP89_13860 [Propionibacteriaceae bacterium]|nr:hypothetical protein [Propionibacteriaceae bacterium]
MNARLVAPLGDHDRADLIARVLGALGTTKAAVQATSWDQGYQPSRPPDASAGPARRSASASEDALTEPRPLVRAKVAGEASLLLRAVAPVSHLDRAVAAAADALAAQIEPQLRDADLLAALAEDPGHALARAFGHLHLRDLGRDDPIVDSLLTEAIRLHPTAERMPTRALEYLWLERLWSGKSTAQTRELALLRQSVIGPPLDVLGCSILDLYSLTHVVLYTSDCGRRPPVLPRHVDQIMIDIESALAIALDADNLDLAAETLWAWPMLGQPWSPAARFAFDILTRTQDEHGFLPGPGYDSGRHQMAPPADRDRYLLETSYHAELVLGILCATMLLPGTAPADHARVPATAGPAEAVLDHLIHPVDPRWLKGVRALSSIERAPLAPLLLTAALRRAAMDHDLTQVQAILRTARRHDLLGLPAATQALALLRRSTLLAQALKDRRHSGRVRAEALFD